MSNKQIQKLGKKIGMLNSLHRCIEVVVMFHDLQKTAEDEEKAEKDKDKDK